MGGAAVTIPQAGKRLENPGTLSCFEPLSSPQDVFCPVLSNGQTLAPQSFEEDFKLTFGPISECIASQMSGKVKNILILRRKG